MNKCTEEDCERVAFFGVSGDRKRCQIHRNEQDINCSDIVCENQSDIEFYENIEKVFLNEENMFFSDDILFYL